MAPQRAVLGLPWMVEVVEGVMHHAQARHDRL
jgi:hypothetical protein